MNNKCINFKIRTKKGIKYFYCTKRKQIITYSNCKTCNDKEFKQYKTLNNRTNKQLNPQTIIQHITSQMWYDSIGDENGPKINNGRSSNENLDNERITKQGHSKSIINNNSSYATLSKRKNEVLDKIFNSKQKSIKRNNIEGSARTNKDVDNTSFSLTNNNLKENQLEIIKNSNPANDDYHTWIRNIEDIKTLEEALEDSNW